MAIELHAGGSNIIETTARSWPKCDRCSKRLGYEYPVEMHERVERRPLPSARDLLTIRGRCHDETQIAELEIPAWWPEAYEHDAIRQLRFFQRSGTGRLAKPTHDMPMKANW